MAIAVFAAGCGSDDGESDGSVTTSDLTKAQFIAKSDAICNDRREKMQKEIGIYLNRSDTRNPEESDVVAATTEPVLIPGAQDQVDEIRALGAPAGEEEQVEALLDAMQQGVDSLDGKQFATFEEISGEFRQFDEMARRYGLEICLFG